MTDIQQNLRDNGQSAPFGKTESKQLIAYESHLTEPGRSDNKAGRSAQVRGGHLVASLADALLSRHAIFPLLGEGRLRDELKERL